MTEKHRQLNDHDLLNYLQENNALLKTILNHLEQSSDNPSETKQRNLEVYREFFKDTKFVFNENTKIK
jgi:hypothetical protein